MAQQGRRLLTPEEVEQAMQAASGQGGPQAPPQTGAPSRGALLGAQSRVPQPTATPGPTDPFGVISRTQREPGKTPTLSEDDLAGVLKLLGIASVAAVPGGMTPAAVLTRSLLGGGFNAAANAAEGEDPIEGFAWGAVPEAVLPPFAGHLRRAGTEAAIMSTSRSTPRQKRKELAGSFEKEYQAVRGEQQLPSGGTLGNRAITVGDQKTPTERLSKLEAEFDPTYAASTKLYPATDPSIMGAADPLKQGAMAGRFPSELVDDLNASTRGALVSHLTEAMRRSPDPTHQTWLRLFKGDISTAPDRLLQYWALEPDLMMSARAFADKMVASKQAGQKATLAQKAGTYLPPEKDAIAAQLPAEQARLMQERLFQDLPPEYQDLVSRYGNLKTIEKFNNTVFDPIGRKGIRGGFGAGIGGSLGALFSALTGNDMITSSGLGAALGLTAASASPRMISRTANTLARGAEVGPQATRSIDLINSEVKRSLGQKKDKEGKPGEIAIDPAELERILRELTPPAPTQRRPGGR